MNEFILNDNTGMKFIPTFNLMDSSTMTGDMVYPVNGKSYYTVDNNTMIEV